MAHLRHFWIISSTSLLCSVGPQSESTLVEVGVVVGSGLCVGNSTVQFQFTTSPIVDTIHPSTGHTAGGSQVTVEGKFFQNLSTCFFGGIEVPAMLTTSTAIHCDAPPHSYGEVLLSVSIDGTATSSSRKFLYVERAILKQVTPSRGPVSGGFAVTVHGAGFPTDFLEIVLGDTKIICEVCACTLLMTL